MRWEDYINESGNTVDTKAEEEKMLQAEKDKARHIINDLGFNLSPQRVQNLIASPASCFSINTVYDMFGPAGVIRLLKLKRVKGIR